MLMRQNTTNEIPPFRRYYVIRKIKEDTCVYEINQNQILSKARECIMLENPVSFNDTVSYWEILCTAYSGFVKVIYDGRCRRICFQFI